MIYPSHFVFLSIEGQYQQEKKSLLVLALKVLEPLHLQQILLQRRDPKAMLALSKKLVEGKVINLRYILKRTLTDLKLRVNEKNNYKHSQNKYQLHTTLSG